MHWYLKQVAQDYIRKRLDKCCPEVRETFFRSLNLWPESTVPLEQAFEQYFITQTYEAAMNFLDQLPETVGFWPYGKREDYEDWYENRT